MAKVKVMNPFANPIAAASRRPSKIAARDGTPAIIKSDVAIGVSANVEPTERSNSPQIIRIVTPIETRPTSGSSPECRGDCRRTEKRRPNALRTLRRAKLAAQCLLVPAFPG